jgi:release factor H-coupled RctB family protein
LDDPWTGSVSAWLSNYGIARVSAFDAASLGTVGAGNHFAELCSVEKIVDDTAAAQLGVLAGGLYLLGTRYSAPATNEIFISIL